MLQSSSLHYFKFLLQLLSEHKHSNEAKGLQALGSKIITL